MYRRKTVEAIVRQHAREREQLLAVIRDQADRLMLLAGRQYAPTPLETHNELRAIQEEPEEEIETVDPGQLADDLGFPV